MVIILGLGFTGQRLAKRLLRHGREVSAGVRDVARFRELADKGLQVKELRLENPEVMRLPRQSTMAVMIPPLAEPENANLRRTIQKLAPSRVVYVSSTGIYGDEIDVDSDTPAEPNDARGRLRLEEERWIASGQWESLILRSAAIYGPGRGVHAALREGRLPRGAGAGIVSRIHVEDLAAIIEAGLFSHVIGAWPLADDLPCSSSEIAAWCSELLGLENAVGNEKTVVPIAGRKVNGGKIREILGIELQYPVWQTGIQASIDEENASSPA
jgi:nucleoside-diphosphate-sugar epimerase